jgi:hypothetical protein
MVDSTLTYIFQLHRSEWSDDLESTWKEGWHVLKQYRNTPVEGQKKQENVGRD